MSRRMVELEEFLLAPHSCVPVVLQSPSFVTVDALVTPTTHNEKADEIVPPSMTLAAPLPGSQIAPEPALLIDPINTESVPFDEERSICWSDVTAPTLLFDHYEDAHEASVSVSYLKDFTVFFELESFSGKYR